MLACPFEPIPAYCTACPACGVVRIPIFGTVEGRPDPSMCLRCGHVFFAVLGGRGRNLTPAEKQWLWGVNARHGERGRRYQEAIVAKLWG